MRLMTLRQSCLPGSEDKATLDGKRRESFSNVLRNWEQQSVRVAGRQQRQQKHNESAADKRPTSEKNLRKIVTELRGSWDLSIWELRVSIKYEISTEYLWTKFQVIRSSLMFTLPWVWVT